MLAFLVSLSDDLLFGLNFECRGDHFGGNFGVILVIVAVQASIWTPKGPQVPKKSQTIEVSVASLLPLAGQGTVFLILTVSREPVWE